MKARIKALQEFFKKDCGFEQKESQFEEDDFDNDIVINLVNNQGILVTEDKSKWDKYLKDIDESRGYITYKKELFLEGTTYYIAR